MSTTPAFPLPKHLLIVGHSASLRFLLPLKAFNARKHGMARRLARNGMECWSGRVVMTVRLGTVIIGSEGTQYSAQGLTPSANVPESSSASSQ